MSIWNAILLGVVQGVAEFLPVSSSGHLALLQSFFPALAPEDSLFFDVVLHLGTLLALTVSYRRELRGILKALLSLPRRAGEKTAERRLTGLLALGTLPLVLVLPLKDRIAAAGGSAVFAGAALLVNGCLLYISDRIAAGRKNALSARAGDALLVGLAQALAAFPGISRSGSTVTAGLLAGFDRSFAVSYSFLLSFPAVLGACLLKLWEAFRAGFDRGLLLPCLAGAAAAALAGMPAIGLVRVLARRGSFRTFAYYCWAAGLGAIIFSLLIP